MADRFLGSDGKPNANRRSNQLSASPTAWRSTDSDLNAASDSIQNLAAEAETFTVIQRMPEPVELMEASTASSLDLKDGEDGKAGEEGRRSLHRSVTSLTARSATISGSNSKQDVRQESHIETGRQSSQLSLSGIVPQLDNQPASKQATIRSTSEVTGQPVIPANEPPSQESRSASESSKLSKMSKGVPAHESTLLAKSQSLPRLAVRSATHLSSMPLKASSLSMMHLAAEIEVQQSKSSAESASQTASMRQSQHLQRDSMPPPPQVDQTGIQEIRGANTILVESLPSPADDTTALLSRVAAALSPTDEEVHRAPSLRTFITAHSVPAPQEVLPIQKPQSGGRNSVSTAETQSLGRGPALLPARPQSMAQTNPMPSLSRQPSTNAQPGYAQNYHVPSLSRQPSVNARPASAQNYPVPSLSRQPSISAHQGSAQTNPVPTLSRHISTNGRPGGDSQTNPVPTLSRRPSVSAHPASMPAIDPSRASMQYPMGHSMQPFQSSVDPSRRTSMQQQPMMQPDMLYRRPSNNVHLQQQQQQPSVQFQSGVDQAQLFRRPSASNSPLQQTFASRRASIVQATAMMPPLQEYSSAMTTSEMTGAAMNIGMGIGMSSGMTGGMNSSLQRANSTAGSQSSRTGSVPIQTPVQNADGSLARKPSVAGTPAPILRSNSTRQSSVEQSVRSPAALAQPGAVQDSYSQSTRTTAKSGFSPISSVPAHIKSERTGSRPSLTNENESGWELHDTVRQKALEFSHHSLIGTGKCEMATQTELEDLVLPSEHWHPLDVMESNIDDDDLARTTLSRLARSATKRRNRVSVLDPSESPLVPLTAEAKAANRSHGSLLKKSNPELYQSVVKKRQRQRLEIENKRAKYNIFQRWWHDVMRQGKQLRRAMKRRGIWRRDLRYIESRFGSGIAGYFRLFRWVFFVNLLLALLWSLVVILFGMFEMSQRDLAGWKRFGNMTSNNFITGLLSGSGNYQQSFFFYGNYKPRVPLSLDPPSIQEGYHMDVAYFATICAFYLLSFLFILWRMRRLLVAQPEMSENIAVDDAAPFAVVLFSGWDYSVCRKETSDNHRFAMVTVIKTLLAQKELQKKKQEISRQDLLWNIFRRICGNLMVLGILAISAVLVFLSMCADTSAQISGCTDNFVTSMFRALNISQFISPTALMISIFNVCLPLVFAAIARFERYTNPAMEETMTLARSFLLKMASVYLILIGFYLSYGSYSADTCWENQVGKSFYQLIWSDLFVTVIATVGYGFATRVFCGKQSYNFGLSANTLEIIYRQSLIWVGTIFAPMSIVVSCASLWAIFHVKKFVLVHCGLPPRRIYNSYQQNFFFSAVMLLTLGLMVFPVFFALTWAQPMCGPFSEANRLAYGLTSLKAIYGIVEVTIDSFESEALKQILRFLGTAGFIGPVFCIMLLTALYLQAVAKKRKRRMRALEREVKLERTDKRFLIRFYKIRT